MTIPHLFFSYNMISSTRSMIEILKWIIYLSKSISRLDKLSRREIEGNYNKITLVKFITRTPLKVPFSNGRSIRGLAFDNNLIKDPFFKMIFNISKKKTFEETRDEFFDKCRVDYVGTGTVGTYGTL